MLNDRPHEGIALLGKNDRPADSFALLAAQLRFAEAFDLADQFDATTAKKSKELKERRRHFELDIQRGRALSLVGDQDKARTLFARLAKEIQEAHDAEALGPLLEAEALFGEKESALNHLADFFPLPQEQVTPGRLLDRIFPDKGKTGEVWWHYFQQRFPQEKPRERVRRVRNVLDGTMPRKLLEALIEEADGTFPSKNLESRQKWEQASLDILEAAGLAESVRVFLDKWAARTDPVPESLILLGDALAKQKRWHEAAERYGQAWKRGPGRALPLYLQGWALMQIGRSRDGGALIDKARLLPLGDAEKRHALAEGLSKRHLDEAARAEFGLLLRTAPVDSWYRTDDLWRLIRGASLKRNYAEAANQYDRIVVDVLAKSWGFARPAAYLSVPSAGHRYRARALVASGQREAARQEIDLALAALPGEIDLAIELYPEMEARGWKKDADELFVRHSFPTKTSAPVTRAAPGRTIRLPGYAPGVARSLTSASITPAAPWRSLRPMPATAIRWRKSISNAAKRPRPSRKSRRASRQSQERVLPTTTPAFRDWRPENRGAGTGRLSRVRRSEGGQHGKERTEGLR